MSAFRSTLDYQPTNKSAHPYPIVDGSQAFCRLSTAKRVLFGKSIQVVSSGYYITCMPLQIAVNMNVTTLFSPTIIRHCCLAVGSVTNAGVEEWNVTAEEGVGVRACLSFCHL